MKRVLAAALVFALSGAAAATEFNVVQADKSRLAFVSKQMGVPVEGVFRRFSPRIAFDPAHPAAGRAEIDVDVASIDAGSKDANTEVIGAKWFDVREHPRASFVSRSVKMLAPGRYEARGQLTIKGRTRDVAVPFAAHADGAALVLEGAVPIRRLQFGIGEGVWSDTDVVADEVQLRFRISLAAGGK